MSPQLPTAAQAKDQARQMRTKAGRDGAPLGHAKSLEIVAHRHGFRDWNTMSAAIANGPPHGWTVGSKVKGRFLSKPFTAHVVSVANVKPQWFRLELQLEEAIDVVTSDGFSNFRSRISGVVGPKGHSMERTSNGHAQLEVDLW